MPITITEALAEIKTIEKRVEQKLSFVSSHLGRQDGVKDPLEKDGGSPQVIARTLQSISDLHNRIVELRSGIAKANTMTTITIEGVTNTIADWIIWKREVAPKTKELHSKLKHGISSIRQTARQSNVQIVAAGNTANSPSDIVVNIDEMQLAKDIEQLENILGQLDGQLSLKNATTFIDID